MYQRRIPAYACSDERFALKPAYLVRNSICGSAGDSRKAGNEFADPDYDLSVDWLQARSDIYAARRRHDDQSQRSRVLVICAAARNDKTCPGEMSKSFRLAHMARSTLEAADTDVDLLDLSVLTSEYGKVIYPCKGCVSTAMPLCHWPCSCYPNHSLGQVTDWMNEIYPRWVAAHGIMIITPVYWYQAPSVLRLMIDRLVCADGGNPDLTTTHGKKVDEDHGLHEEVRNAARALIMQVTQHRLGIEMPGENLIDPRPK
jgi:multimeric flavodoxin WrbA